MMRLPVLIITVDARVEMADFLFALKFPCFCFFCWGSIWPIVGMGFEFPLV